MPDELRISIEKLVYGGDGLAHADGNTVFVPYVLPGEQVRAATKSKRKKLVWAQLLEVTSASAQREGARCPHFQTCGRRFRGWVAFNGLVRFTNIRPSPTAIAIARNGLCVMPIREPSDIFCRR